MCTAIHKSTEDLNLTAQEIKKFRHFLWQMRDDLWVWIAYRSFKVPRGELSLWAKTAGVSCQSLRSWRSRYKKIMKSKLLREGLPEWCHALDSFLMSSNLPDASEWPRYKR